MTFSSAFAAPWLIAGKTPSEVITANIRLAESALKERIGVVPAGSARRVDF